ncbi:hypothetical protein GGI26_006324 [Coemansia sp. RSA 1358]|nr:hypothetical protein GGI26_006324 [Coemansia sp. RSA 1358]
MSKDDERGGPVDDSRIGRPRTHPLFPLQQNDRASLQSGFVKSFMGKEQSAVWTRHMAKRRALMFLSDMWRYSGTIQPVDSRGYLLSDTAAHLDHEDLIRRNKKYSAWRPSEHHYNIVFDVIGRDPSSKIEEIMALHGDMRARSVKEDTVTFNTILNACRQLGHWMYFIDIEQQMKERDEWGVTRMNARSWGTLIQGYKECKDWESVDKCISQATSACRVWYKAETDGKTPKKRGVEPTSQLWCTIISVYAARNMISQMLAARRIMSGFGLRMSAYVFGPIFSALHKARRLKLRDGKDIWPVIRIALSEYEAMVGAGVEPNPTMLTNLMLTIGFDDSELAANAVDATEIEERSRERKQKSAVSNLVSQRLESILVRAHNPNIYAALISIAGRTKKADEVQALWKTLIAEAQLPRAGSSGQHRQILSSLTLAAYMNALINCKSYDAAISAFLEYKFSNRSDDAKAEMHRKYRSPLPSLLDINRDVYETSLKAFALANKHRMCPIVISQMINSGIQPSVLTLRYSLLPPEFTDISNAQSQDYTRPWSLSLVTARKIWDLVLPARQQVWTHRSPYMYLKSGRRIPESELPVITSDVAAQLIRIAAYAHHVQFGEQVFTALISEANHYGAGYRYGAGEAANTERTDDEYSRSNTDLHSCLPADIQCVPNVYVYTSMITLYANCADLDGVGRIWTAMLRDGIEPNLHTYTSLAVALHKYALRRRWRQVREHAKSTEVGSIGEYSNTKNVTPPPWATAKHDQMIDSIEEWITKGKTKVGQKQRMSEPSVEDSRSSDSSSKLPFEMLKDAGSLDLDIPLSTLLLRYRAVRIREAAGRSTKDGINKQDALAERESIKQIQRAMELCQKVEFAGLKPDLKFHTALADFFEACGDRSGAELVRGHIKEMRK